MPVVPDSAASKFATLAAAATSGSVTVPVTVNRLAVDRLAVAALLLTGSSATIHDATYGATFGGVAMTAVKTVPFFSNKSLLKVFMLEDPLIGDQNVVLSVSSLSGPDSDIRALMGAVSTYSGEDAVDIANAVTASGTNTVNNSVTVASVKPAHRVITIHAVASIPGGGQVREYFTSYDKVQRASVVWNNIGNHLLIGDAPGAASVTATATHLASTTVWAAVGFTVAPAIVDGSASLQVPQITTTASGGVVRVQPPSPERTWVLKGGSVRERQRWDHDLSATLDYTIDWGNKTIDGDYLVNATFTPADTTVSVFSDNLYPEEGSTKATVWLQGGTLNEPVDVNCHVIWHSGRQDSATFQLFGRRK